MVDWADWSNEHPEPPPQLRWASYIVESPIGDSGRLHMAAAAVRMTESGDLAFLDDDGSIIVGLAAGVWTRVRRVR